MERAELRLADFTAAIKTITPAALRYVTHKSIKMYFTQFLNIFHSHVK